MCCPVVEFNEPSRAVSVCYPVRRADCQGKRGLFSGRGKQISPRILCDLASLREILGPSVISPLTTAPGRIATRTNVNNRLRRCIFCKSPYFSSRPKFQFILHSVQPIPQRSPSLSFLVASMSVWNESVSIIALAKFFSIFVYIV